MIKGMFEPYKGLPRSAYIIFAATILNNLGNFVAPVLTLLMKEQMGIDVAVVGFIVAINGLLGLLGSLVGGQLIDRVGRKSIFVFFRVIAALALMSCVVIDEATLMVGVLMFVNFTSGIASPVFNTILTDVTSSDERKAAFSLRYLGINIGYAVGPVIATQLYRLGLMNVLFIGDALTVLGSVVLILLFVPETKPTVTEAKVKESDMSTVQVLITAPTLLYFSGICVLFFIVFSQFSFGMPLTMTEVLGEGGAGHYGIMLSINALVCSVFTVPLTTVTKNLSPARSIQLGGVLYAVGFGSYAILKIPILFYIFTAVWTIGEILVATNTSVFIADHSPVSHRGRFNAIFPIIRRIGSFLGPILAGLILKSFNYSTLWIVIAILAIAASWLMRGIDAENVQVSLEK